MTTKQTDIFELLDEKPPQPAFTVYTGPDQIRASYGKCGYCGKNGFAGGGCGPARDDKPRYAYSYCTRCLELHGYPKHWAPNWILVHCPERTTND